MTFIQPNKNSTFSRIFLTLIVLGLVGGTFWLITSYNRIVSFNHALAVAKADLDSIGAQNTALNNQIVVTLGNADQLSAIATSDGLVIAKPQYVTVAP